MNVEYTGRQFEITPAIRKEVETGLHKLTKILGENFKSKVILTAEKQRRIAEITISRRTSPIVAIAESVDMTLALGEALENIERQVLKFNGRRRDTKRVAKSKWKREAPEIEAQLVVGASASTAVPVVVHKFPASSHTSEAHLITNQDSVALSPMTVEEAIKECEFRDREVFVFRDKVGRVKVLHRTKDGRLEIIEA